MSSRGPTLSSTPQENNLSDKHYVTVILRLTVDRQERLVHGEVVDIEGKSQGWFAGWRGLIRVVRDYLLSKIVA